MLFLDTGQENIFRITFFIKRYAYINMKNNGLKPISTEFRFLDITSTKVM